MALVAPLVVALLLDRHFVATAGRTTDEELDDSCAELGVALHRAAAGPHTTAQDVAAWAPATAGVYAVHVADGAEPKTQLALAQRLATAPSGLVYVLVAAGPLYWQLAAQCLFREPDTRAPHDQADVGAVAHFQKRVPRVYVSPEIRRYMWDVVAHVRNHRFVVGGVPFGVYRDLEQMVRVVAVAEGRLYATPQSVKTAVARVLPFRLQLVQDVYMEPSIQWGSEPELVAAVLDMTTQDMVVGEVLGTVYPPV